MANKVAFINGKGGCSKTTSIFHIAGVLSERGEKVLIIDLDKQRNSTQVFLASENSDYNEKSCTVLDFMHGKAIQDVVKKSYFVGIKGRIERYRNIDVLPSDVRLENESELDGIDIKERLNWYIDTQGYDWVLVDMPPSSKKLNDICFQQIADYIMIPFSSDVFSVTGYGDIVDTVNSARMTNPNLKIIGIFLSRYMKNCAVDRYIREQLLNFGEMFMDIQIPEKADIREAVMFGRPISYYKEFSPSRKAYESLVREMDKRL